MTPELGVGNPLNKEPHNGAPRWFLGWWWREWLCEEVVLLAVWRCARSFVMWAARVWEMLRLLR